MDPEKKIRTATKRQSKGEKEAGAARKLWVNTRHHKNH